MEEIYGGKLRWYLNKKEKSGNKSLFIDGYYEDLGWWGNEREGDDEDYEMDWEDNNDVKKDGKKDKIIMRN